MKDLKKMNPTYVASMAIFQKNGRLFWSIKDIINDVTLTPHERILFQIIMTLSLKEGYCFASNEYLKGKLGLSQSRVKFYLAKLEKEGLISTEMKITNFGRGRLIHIEFRNLRRRYLKK